MHPGEGDDQGCWQQWRTDRDREEQRRIAQQRRDRKVRNKLSRVVAVLDELLRVASESGCKSTGRFAASWVSIRAGELK